MELSIIIVNWNALDYLRECIASIYAHTGGYSFEIIVVDNASTKEDVDALKIPFPEVKIIKSGQNLGFARANNLGCRQAKGSYVLLLNPDTKLVGPAATILLERMRSLPDAGIVGCRQVSPDLTVQTTSIQKFPTIANQLLNIEYLRLRWPACSLWNIAPLFRDNPLPVAVEVIPGACMLLRRAVFEKVGMFSEEYFMYAEDIDLNFKVAQLGLRNYYVSDAVIIHYGGISSSQKSVSQWSTMMKYRAMGQYYAKNHGPAYAAGYRIAMAVCAICRIAVLALAYPFGSMSTRQALRFTMQKWGTVFKWSLGLVDRSFNVNINP
ncbi:MAG: glycosyltransferase family 2 protein [Pseudomonadota bacterium]